MLLQRSELSKIQNTVILQLFFFCYVQLLQYQPGFYIPTEVSRINLIILFPGFFLVVVDSFKNPSRYVDMKQTFLFLTVRKPLSLDDCWSQNFTDKKNAVCFTCGISSRANHQNLRQGHQTQSFSSHPPKSMNK